MNDLQAMTYLLAKVEAGTAHGGSAYALAGIDAEEGLAAFHGSTDAAMALHEVLLPDWRAHIEVGRIYRAWVISDKYNIHGCSDSPARSWLIAIIKALIAKAKETT